MAHPVVFIGHGGAAKATKMFWITLVSIGRDACLGWRMVKEGNGKDATYRPLSTVLDNSDEMFTILQVVDPAKYEAYNI